MTQGNCKPNMWLWGRNRLGGMHEIFKLVMISVSGLRITCERKDSFGSMHWHCNRVSVCKGNIKGEFLLWQTVKISMLSWSLRIAKILLGAFNSLNRGLWQLVCPWVLWCSLVKEWITCGSCCLNILLVCTPVKAYIFLLQWNCNMIFKAWKAIPVQLSCTPSFWTCSECHVRCLGYLCVVFCRQVHSLFQAGWRAALRRRILVYFGYTLEVGRGWTCPSDVH